MDGVAEPSILTNPVIVSHKWCIFAEIGITGEV